MGVIALTVGIVVFGQAASGIQLRLLSAGYSFLKGNLSLIGVSHSRNEVSLSSRSAVTTEGLNTGVQTAAIPFRDGLTQQLALTIPGRFLVTLSEVTAINSITVEEVYIPYFPLGEYEITNFDVERRVATIKIRPFGTLVVQVLDQRDRPVPNETIAVLSPYVSGALELETNNRGDGVSIALEEGVYTLRAGHAPGVRVEVKASTEARIILRAK